MEDLTLLKSAISFSRIP